MESKEKNAIIDEIANEVTEEVLNENLGDVFFNKVRERSFIFLTFVFAGLSVVFYFLKFQASDLLMQLFIGFATGCFVVVMQEIAKKEGYKKREDERKRIKRIAIDSINKKLAKRNKNTGEN